MRIGISVDIQELDKALIVITRWRTLINHIQIYFDCNSERSDDNHLRQFLHQLDADITCSFHSYGYLNLAEQNSTIREAMIRVATQTIDVLHQVKGLFVNFHLGYSLSTSTTKEKLLSIAKDSVFRLCSYAQQYGIEIHIENDINYGIGTTLGTSIEDLQTVLTGQPNNLRICYDIGHANLTMSSPYAYEMIKPNIGSVHIHNNNGINDEHLTINQGGSIDLLRVINDNELSQSAMLILENDLSQYNGAFQFLDGFPPNKF